MPRSASESEAKYHSIVVVGAGLSGLQAANKLITKYPDLLLVEASSRLGGRVQQVGRLYCCYKFLWHSPHYRTSLQKD